MLLAIECILQEELLGLSGAGIAEAHDSRFLYPLVKLRHFKQIKKIMDALEQEGKQLIQAFRDFQVSIRTSTCFNAFSRHCMIPQWGEEGGI